MTISTRTPPTQYRAFLFIDSFALVGIVGGFRFVAIGHHLSS